MDLIKSYKTKKRIGKIILYIFVIIMLIFYVFPFYYAITSSLTPNSELFSKSIKLFPKNPTFKNYILVFTERPFHQNIINSVIVAGATTILSLVFGAFAGYAVARLKMPGKVLIMSLILAVSMFPQVSILGALFQILRNMRLINTYPGLILPYIALNLPLTTWILHNFFKDIPISIEESAAIDGCSKFMTLWRIIIPLSAPGLVTTGLLTFIAAWNEFMFALTFMQLPEKYTVPVAIAMFSGKTFYELPWGQLMAAAVIVTVPLVALVLIFQNKIVAGLTAGAVKG
ncbi:carbohydrate ABC transporter permease [Marinitoga litoralis]|uniref:carbohydrate ABC transporter permease n=1 Tax=Marinitoga litoralis TaxID=570855 RepID=UPI00195FEC1F|nr:carbohydrate ABC transporter permease [Marinitoga litoralis]MBM7558592.1 multiple sugar transport system permease protein [Marinitoga litoralis]